MKNVILCTLFLSIYLIGLSASNNNQIDQRDRSGMTPLQIAASRGNLVEFAKELALGANPNEKWIVTLNGDEYNRIHADRQTVTKFLETSTKVSSARTIDPFTAEKMLSMLRVRSSLISYFSCCDTWTNLNTVQRLEELCRHLAVEDRLAIDQMTIEMK
jgi:ankyrin repeat protein